MPGMVRMHSSRFAEHQANQWSTQLSKKGRSGTPRAGGPTQLADVRPEANACARPVVSS
jgi:hypothetical protein